MSKAEKMQKRLANLQKEREEFERQKQQLELEMNIGKKNMGKIQKSLKNHLTDIELLDTESVLTEINTSRDASKVLSRKVSNGKPQLFSMNTSSSTIAAAAGGTGADKAMLDTLDEHQHPVIVPSGPRISDWPFTAPLDSSPPVVKSRDLYENIRLLGRGSFGEVNLAKNVEDHKLFAIKTIFCSRDSELQSVMRELKFLRMNHHPFVIDVHDAFITSNPRVVHIVMHYCESGTLSSVIQAAKRNKNMISESQVLKWVVQLALAMHCLHENRTVHRDLKPMNVMLTEGGDILKLADFGLAMDMREASKGENFDEAGTPYYTAPEMIQRESYSFPTDCWSFGVILFQLLSLERPFDGASTADLVKSILTNEPPPLPAHYSEEIREICKNLLKKNQSERLTMAQLLCEPLIYGKAAACPQNFRPKHTEERIRRSQSKQLEQQIEVLSKQRKLQASNTSGKFSSDASFNGATEGMTGLTPRVHADGFLAQFPDPIAMPMINTVIDEGDVSLKSNKGKSPLVAKSPYSNSKRSPSAAAQKQTMAPVTEEDLDLMLKATEKTLHHTSHNKNVIEDILHPDQPHRRTHFHSSKANTPLAAASSSGHPIKSTPRAATSPLASVVLDSTSSAAAAVPPFIDPLAVSVEELVQHIDSKIAARQPVGLALPLSARLQKIEAFETDISTLSQKLKEGQDKLEIIVQPDSNEPNNQIAEHLQAGESNTATLSPPLSSRLTDHNGLHSGGRKGRAIAEAIENDHLFEKQLSQELHNLKEEHS